jgi:hypothetical protein
MNSHEKLNEFNKNVVVEGVEFKGTRHRLYPHHSDLRKVFAMITVKATKKVLVPTKPINVASNEARFMGFDYRYRVDGVWEASSASCGKIGHTPAVELKEGETAIIQLILFTIHPKYDANWKEVAPEKEIEDDFSEYKFTFQGLEQVVDTKFVHQYLDTVV